MAGTAACGLAMLARATRSALRAQPAVSNCVQRTHGVRLMSSSTVGVGGAHDVGGDPQALKDPIATLASADMQAWELSCHSVSCARASQQRCAAHVHSTWTFQICNCAHWMLSLSLLILYIIAELTRNFGNLRTAAVAVCSPGDQEDSEHGRASSGG